MLTILAMPKSFRGHFAMIQRNAIRSWTLLRPKPEIILCGYEEGVAEIAAELGLIHVSEVARNEYGTPLLRDLLDRAEHMATNQLLAYLNADIILIGEWMDALAIVSKRFDRFLIVGRRVNIDVQEEISFVPEWDASQKKQMLAGGTPGSHTAIDLFIFPKGTYRQVPPFAIGRVWFDQWLIKAARRAGVPVVDVTAFAPVVHQNHDYSHVSGGMDWSYRGVEAENNLRLYGEAPHTFTLLDVTHELTREGRIERVRFRRQGFMTRQWLWESLSAGLMCCGNAWGFAKEPGKEWLRETLRPRRRAESSRPCAR